ncbi:MAG: DUF4258 domain-containing protein [Chloroflexi bacterium]|nr:DUF4258 domain-containing protein [Chloroflexota bacterium]
MDIEAIKARVWDNQYVYTLHAEIERKAEELTFAQIEEALLSGEILEQYPDTGRGESCLVVGFAGGIPIHIICGWHGEKIALITVYVPRPPKFVDPWTRGGTP